MKLLLPAGCAGLAVLCATAGAGARIAFSLDYSLDVGGIFGPGSSSGRSAQAAMDRAAQVFSDRLLDRLTPITPGGDDTWSPHVINPGTGLDSAAPLTIIAVNVIKVYVGSRSLSATEVGSTVAGFATVGGSQAFMDNALSRGQAGALASPKTDVGPWGGSIAFDTGTNWYFGATTGGLTANKIDFQTVATHEFEHLLGFSSSQPSWAALVSAGKFTGPKAAATNGGIAPSVTGSHWLGMSSTVGPTGPSQVALMDAGVPTGVRRRMTQLDWAALDDLGWELAMPGDANADGMINFLDFQAIEIGFGETNSRWSHGDFNEDGMVDSADLALLIKNYGKRSDGTFAPRATADEQTLAAFGAGVNVPEPAGLFIFGIALLFINRAGRRAIR